MKEEPGAAVLLISHLFDFSRSAGGGERHGMAPYNFGIANEDGPQELGD